MEIEFVESKVLSLSFLTEQKDLEDNLNLQYALAFAVDDKNKFVVKFDVKLTFESGAAISLEYAGLFETNVEMTEEFKQGHFVSVNAPAITFPYLRSFITTFTANAGLEPVILPTVNFQAIAAKAAETA